MAQKSIKTGDGYKQFLQSLELVGIALTECRFAIDRAKFFETEEQLFVDNRFEVLRVESEALEIKALFTTKAASSEKEEGSMTLDAVYTMHFHCSQAAPCSRELADRFVKSEARVVLWPFLRELASAITARASVPPVVLPLAITRRRDRSY